MDTKDTELLSGLTLEFETPRSDQWRIGQWGPGGGHALAPPAGGPPADAAVAAIATRDAPACLFRPLHYEPRYEYPLLVWLHDCGEDERILRRVMPEISMRNFAGVAPRGVAAATTKWLAAAPSAQGFDWPESREARALASQRVDACLAMAARTVSFRRDRVFLGGCGAGGTLALELAFAAPDRFAGVASVEGSVPKGRPWLSRLADARGLPVLLAAGSQRQSPAGLEMPPAALAHEFLADQRLLFAAGARLTVFEACESEPSAPFAEINRWIMRLIGAC